MKLSFLLFPFACLFWLIVKIRDFLYRQNLKKSHNVKVPVICVGNLTTGGTGKTPWVQYLSRFYKNQGVSHSIISRGYTGDFSGVLQVSSEMDPRRCGDEPLWLKNNTEASVYVAKNRFAAASEAIQEDAPSLLILDDGFQHRALKRDFNLILIDASVAKHDYHLLPVGRLREPFSSLKRAHSVIINKCNYALPGRVEALKQSCLKWVHEDQLFFSDFCFDHWEPLIDSLPKDLDSSLVSLTCGVGNPRAFQATVNEQSLEIKKTFIYPDHYYWKPHDIEKMTYHMKQVGSRNLVMTEKDAVKLNRYKKHFVEMHIQLWVCKMTVKINDRQEAFHTRIKGLQKS